MKNIFILILAFFVVGINVNAQEKSRKGLRGDKYSFRYSFDKAIVAYTHVKDLSTERQRRLAISYHNIGQNAQAEVVYLKLLSAASGVIPEDYYNYAMVLKINGKYDESNIWMAKFAEIKPDDLRAQHYLAHKNEIPIMLADDGKYRMYNLNTNSTALDFGPSYYKNKIVYVSSRSSARMIVRKYNWTIRPFWNMYVTEMEGGQMKKPKKFNRRLNGKLHDGPAGFSNDGNFMAYTTNHYHDRSKDKVVELQIHFCSFKDGKWSKPRPFYLNNEKYSVGHACLTADGNVMYFSSNMPGGFGGADIYRIRKNDQGEWAEPENLGSTINTEGDEMFPFLEEKNGILMFTSNGHFGIGGLDVFVCRLTGSGFGRVYNMGYPLNTQYDDYAAILNADMTKGYVSSNRPGGVGGDDIYSFDMLKPFNFDNAAVRFAAYAPENIPAERRVRETFPLRNYVFFDAGSTEIPDRYVLLDKDQVKSFNEDQLEVFIPKNLSGRSKRQMVVYYNILNIIGDRMNENPAAKIRLAGSSQQGVDDGLAMAESVKKYLVTIFEIDHSRIITEGRIKPRIPSEQTGTKTDLELKQQGDRRVTIMSESPELLMEFQSGPDAPLKPVEIVTVHDAPLDSYVTFDVGGGDDIPASWTLEIRDEKGNLQSFGPYTQRTISMPGKDILGKRAEANYSVTMVGNMMNGETVKKDTTLHMVLWTPPGDALEMRFSIIYEFNNSTAIRIYEKYLTEIVIPNIPAGGKVIIHGYTDIIGEEEYNQELSLARANDVKDILKNGLLKIGRKDVSFEVYGFGEDAKRSLFDNNYPEERFYNRAVLIDIIPQFSSSKGR
jgi:hypothetical protein